MNMKGGVWEQRDWEALKSTWHIKVMYIKKGKILYLSHRFFFFLLVYKYTSTKHFSSSKKFTINVCSFYTCIYIFFGCEEKNYYINLLSKA